MDELERERIIQKLKEMSENRPNPLIFFSMMLSGVEKNIKEIRDKLLENMQDPANVLPYQLDMLESSEAVLRDLKMLREEK